MERHVQGTVENGFITYPLLRPIYLYDYPELYKDFWHRFSTGVKPNFFLKISCVRLTVGALGHHLVKVVVSCFTFSHEKLFQQSYKPQ